MLTHHTGGPTDEGWSRETTDWHYRADDTRFPVGCVCSVRSSDEVDCDGRMTTVQTVEADPCRRLANDFAPDGLSMIWRTTDQGQRDYNAEAAGY